MATPTGFSEDQQPFEGQSEGLVSLGRVRLKIGAAGRIVIPADMRAAMFVKPGDTVVAQIVDGELRVLSQQAALKRVHVEAQKFKKNNPGVSVVDELIAERRAEAARDSEEANAWRKRHGLPLLDDGK